MRIPRKNSAAVLLLSALLLTSCANIPNEDNDICTVTDAQTVITTEKNSDATTEAPTDAPTEAPTDTPTEAPTDAPTETETKMPATLSTNKRIYEVDEDIIVTVTGGDGDTVAFYPAAFSVGKDTPIYYATLSGQNSIPRGEPVVLTDFPGTYRNVTSVAFYYGVLPVGDYRLVVTSPEGEICAETDITIQFTAKRITTGAELAAKCLDVVLNYKTLYVNGCFGAPMTDKNKARYTQNTAYNRLPERQAIINAASDDTFGFDCVCLIKGLLWGWDGDLNHVYGGATYTSNEVPDISEGAMIGCCSDVSTRFTKIEVGEVVWLEGHIGVYIGNGLAVECTPAWDDCVQITACNNTRIGYPSRSWSKHGKLPYLTYTGEYESVRIGLQQTENS